MTTPLEDVLDFLEWFVLFTEAEASGGLTSGTQLARAIEVRDQLLPRLKADPRPTRDAALRAEGRAQERADVVAWLYLPAMEAWNHYLVNNPSRPADVSLFAALVRDELRSGEHEGAHPSTDASQGAQRFTEFAAKLGPLPVSAMASGEPAPDAPQGSPLPGVPANPYAPPLGGHEDPCRLCVYGCPRLAWDRAVEATEAHAPLEGGPLPVGEDSCWQETEHRLLMHLEAMIRQIDGSRRGCVRWPDVRKVLQDLTAIRGEEPARIPLEGRALEGELATALRLALRVVDEGQATEADEAGLNDAETLLARYDASQPPASIPQGVPAKERP